MDDDEELASAFTSKTRQSGHTRFTPPPHTHPRHAQPRAEPAHHLRPHSEFPHENDYSDGVFDSAYDAVTGKPAHAHPQFRILGVDVSVANVSLFAHHETTLDDAMTWPYLFTLGMLGMSVVVGVLATFVVSGIVHSYNNGVMFLVVAIGAALLVVLQFGAVLRHWTRHSPFSHIHNNMLLLPTFYYLLAYTAALVALGYWVSKFQADFFDTYDAAAAPAAERPYYYGVYTLLAAICLSTVPDLIASLTVQRYPERKLNLYRELSQPLLYYLTDDPTEGHAVRLGLCE